MTVTVFRMIIRFQLMESILFDIPSAIHDLPQDLVIRMLQRCRQPHPPFSFFSFLFPALMISHHPKFIRAVVYLKSGKIPDFNTLFSLPEAPFSPLVPLKHAFRILKQKPSFRRITVSKPHSFKVLINGAFRYSASATITSAK